MMNLGERLGLVVKQAREEKGWSQEELANRLEIDVGEVSELEAGNGNPEYTTLSGYIFLLNICPDVIFREDDAEHAMKMDHLYRELQGLTKDQFEKLVGSVRHIRRWREDNPNVDTLEDYWKTLDKIGRKE